MSLTFIVIFAHVAGAVLLVGFCLFWALVTSAAWREYPEGEARNLLQIAKSAAWPLPGFPLKMTLIGWLLLAVVVVSGVLAMQFGSHAAASFMAGGFTGPGGLKILLLVALAACMPGLGSSKPALAWASLALAVLIVGVSVHLVR